MWFGCVCGQKLPTEHRNKIEFERSKSRARADPPVELELTDLRLLFRNAPNWRAQNLVSSLLRKKEEKRWV